MRQKLQNVNKLRNGDTPNGGIIRDLMKKISQRGNPKDFVIIVGNRLIDWWHSYNIAFDSGEYGEEAKKSASDSLLLIHKKDLHKVIGRKLAATFWNKKFGMRVSIDLTPKRKKIK